MTSTLKACRFLYRLLNKYFKATSQFLIKNRWTSVWITSISVERLLCKNCQNFKVINRKDLFSSATKTISTLFKIQCKY